MAGIFSHPGARRRQAAFRFIDQRPGIHVSNRDHALEGRRHPLERLQIFQVLYVGRPRIHQGAIGSERSVLSSTRRSLRSRTGQQELLSLVPPTPESCTSGKYPYCPVYIVIAWPIWNKLLGIKVDLVSAPDATNPYFLQVANRHRLTLYAA